MNEKINTLLVEDNKLNSTLINVIFKKFFKNVTLYLAENGQEGVNIFKEKTFNLILMDINLPIMDGIEATRIIRSQPNGQNIPIIFISASLYSDYTNICDELNVDLFIEKPIQLTNFVNMIKKYTIFS